MERDEEFPKRLTDEEFNAGSWVNQPYTAFILRNEAISAIWKFNNLRGRDFNDLSDQPCMWQLSAAVNERIITPIQALKDTVSLYTMAVDYLNERKEKA